MVRVDKLQLDIIINGDPVRSELIKLEKEAASLRKEMKGIKDQGLLGTKKAELAAVEKKMEDLRHQIGLTGMTMKELQQRANQLKIILNNMPPNHVKYKEFKAELDAIGARLGELKGKAAQAKISLGSIADGFNRYFAMVGTIAAVVTGAAISIKKFIDSSAELTDMLADIRKTTGMTSAEVAELNKNLTKISTRTATKELREMAIVAGQLGVNKEDVLGFVQSVDKLNVALSDEFEGGAREVAETVGKLRNVLGDIKTSNISQDLLHIGNALNELGAAGFATSPVIADFSSRIAGVGIPLGLTSDEVLGLSATLQELNVNVERGGTGVTRILQRMTTNTAEFAKIAAMPLTEFTELVNTDLFGAFKKVLEGTKSSGTSATALAGIIKDLEVQGMGASEVFAKLGGNLSMLDEKVSLAGKSLQGTESIMNEFNIKNETLGATIDKMRKEFFKLIQMQGVQEFFKNVVNAVASFIMSLKNLPAWIDKNKVSLTLLTGVILTYIAAKTRAIQVQLWNILTLKEGILLKAKDAIVMQYLIMKEGLLAAAKTQGTIATKAAAVAQWLWNAAIAANPIGLFIMGITALVASLKAYDKYNSESVRLEKEKEQAIRNLSEANKLLEIQYNEVQSSISTLNSLSIQEKKDLSDKISKTLSLADAELILWETKQKQIITDNTRVTAWSYFWNLVVKKNPQDLLNDAMNKGIEAGDSFNEILDSIRNNIKNLRGSQSDLDSILNAEKIADALPTETIANLEEKLSKYQVALKNAATGSADFTRIQGKIKQLNKQMAKFTPDDSDVEKEKNKLKKIYEDIEQLRIDMIEDARKKELAQEKNNLKKKLDEIKGNSASENELRLLLKDQSKKKEQGINEKYDKEDAKKQYDTLKIKLDAEIDANKLKLNLLEEGSISYRQLQIQILEEERELQLANKELTEQQKANITETYRQRIEEVNKGSLQKELDWEEEFASLREDVLGKSAERAEEKDRRELTKKYAKLLKDAKGNAVKLAKVEDQIHRELQERKLQREKETMLKIRDMALQFAGDIADRIYSISKNNNQQALDDKIAKLEAQKNVELSNKNLTEGQKDAINEKYRKKEAQLKTEAFKKERDADSVMAAIKGALAIVNAWTTGSWIENIIESAFITALTAAEIVAIQSQAVPQYSAGKYNVRGMVDGETYNASVMRNAGTRVVKSPAILVGEKPEGIVSGKDMQNPVIKNLFKDIIRVKLGMMPEMNYGNVNRSIKQSAMPQFASGYYPQTTTVTKQEMFTDPKLVDGLNRFNSIIERIEKNGIKGNWVWSDLNDMNAKRDKIKNYFNA